MELKYNNDKLLFSPVNKLRDFRIFDSNENIMLKYSIYENGIDNYGFTKYRSISSVKDINYFYNEIIDIINNLPINRELAIHSKVVKNKSEYHIPFIDFEAPIGVNLFDSLNELQKMFNDDIYIFESGRSYHGYFDALYSKRKWERFLGTLLLLNKTNEIRIIDSRWIGHSLRQGFSSLRLSCNTSAYKNFPRFIYKIPKSR